MDEGDLGTQMLRDFHVPEHLWTEELKEDIWWIVKEIAERMGANPADYVQFYPSLGDKPRAEAIKREREILIQCYRLNGERPPEMVLRVRDVVDPLDSTTYGKKLKAMSDARVLVATLLKRRGYRPRYRKPGQPEGAP